MPVREDTHWGDRKKLRGDTQLGIHLLWTRTRAVGNKKLMEETDNKKEKIAAEGSIRLSSPYHIINTVEYILELSVKDGKYKYRIDSVYIKQAERGGKTTRTASEDLLKDMEVSGTVSANAEKQLNEIDMHFQKLLYLINADMKKPVVVKNAG